MNKPRRRVLIRTLERIGLVLLLADLLVWLGIVRVYDSKLDTEQQLVEGTRRELQEERLRVVRLERIKVTGIDGELNSFLRDHVPSRKNSFSRAGRLVARLSQQSGVQLTGLGYRLNSSKEVPLTWLGLDISVGGPFPSLINFMHAMETASDLLVVRSFNVEPGDQGNLGLRVAADLYVTP